MNRLTSLALYVALGLVSPALAASITISDVQFRAKDTFGIDPTSSVMPMCSVTKGWTAEQADVQRAISNDVKALLNTPDYSAVDASIGQDEDGNWVVIYTVSRRPQLAKAPAITGLDGELRISKAEEAIKLVTNDRVDDAIASAAANRLKAKLEEQGYVDAKVDYELRYSDVPGYAFLSFIVTPGIERDIRDYLFEGNVAFDHDTLAKSFGWMPIWNPLSWFQDFPITDSKLDDARAAAQKVYLDAGYLDAEVTTPNLVQIEGKKPGRVDAVFQVTEGQRYHVGNVTVRGATVYSSESLEAAAKAVLTTNGTLATAATLDGMQEAVELYYSSRGYVDTYAAPTMIPRADAPIIDIVYNLTEGEQAYIRNIEIRGNSITKDKVIRRELAIQPGEFYDGRYVKRSEARVRNLNYFQKESGVTSYTVKTGNPGERDLVFNVRETETGDTGVGIGISSIDNIFLTAKLVQRNFDLFNPKNGFRGGGQRAAIGAEIGDRRQTLDVSWTQPWLFDMPVALTLNGYRTLRWYDHYDEIRTGGTVSLGWKPVPLETPFGELQLDRIGFQYTLEHIGFDDEDSGVWHTKDGKPFSFEDQEDGINSKLRFFWNEEHRDHPYFPKNGWMSKTYAEVGLGGDAKDYGFGFNASKWWGMWNDHVLLTRFRFNTVEAYSGEVPLWDRYFIGGGRTVRGFEFRDGGPKAYDANGHHVGIGGQTQWCATFEYTIPVVSVLRFAVFTDLGSVGEDFCDLGGELLWSAGVGLRLDIDGFPMRIDFAKPLVNDDDTEEEVFTFWLGID